MKNRHPVLREIAVVVFLSAGLALAYNAFTAKSLPLIRVAPVKVEVSDSALFSSADRVSRDTLPAAAPAPKDAGVVAPLHERALRNPDSAAQSVRREKEEKDAALKIITLDQLKRLLAQHRGVLIDARSEDEFAKGHIRGAANIPALEVEKYFEQLVAVPRDTLVIIYCNNADCHLGRTLAEFMQTISFSNLVLYDEGWDGWTGAQMPVDTTASPAGGAQ